MLAHDVTEKNELSKLLHRLSLKSIDRNYNTYRCFAWPDTISEHDYWMSKELLTIYIADLYNNWSEQDLKQLSKWESINFYSLNIHGIRELLIEVINRIHSSGFSELSEFLHHFIDEENEHMWFFSEFCRRYGNKVYPSILFKSLKYEQPDRELEDLMVFARILLFEEIVDFYNVKMAADVNLHSVIRQINSIHHQEEVRHIAFGRKLVAFLYKKIAVKLSVDQHQVLERMLKGYLIYNLNAFYNPYVYKDLGIKDPLEFRAKLLRTEERAIFERRVIEKPMGFFLQIGLFSDDSLLPRVII